MQKQVQSVHLRPAGAYRGYLLLLLFVLASGLLLVLLLNVLVDPFNSHRLIGGEDFARYKAGIATRIGKSEGIRGQSWDVILLGNSRVEVGFDPQHPAWNGQRVFNAALPGANFDELAAASYFALRNPAIKRLVLCIDWTNFDPTIPPNPDFRRSLLNPDFDPVEYHLANLLSTYATDRSMRTIRNWLGKTPSPFTPFGFSTNELKANGRADWRLINYHDFANPDKKAGAKPSTVSASALFKLDQLLSTAARRSVNVDLIDPPIHVISFERTALAGTLPLHEQWLRSVATIVESHRHEGSEYSAQFWDFFTYSVFTTEPYPGPAETTTHMKWYWDPDHFKKELGDLVIDKINTQPAPDGIDLSDFGDVLTTANVENHIAKLHRGREDYLAARPDVKQMIVEARNLSR